MKDKRLVYEAYRHNDTFNKDIVKAVVKAPNEETAQQYLKAVLEGVYEDFQPFLVRLKP